MDYITAVARDCRCFEVCSHLRFVFASTSPSNFIIASLETQTQTSSVRKGSKILILNNLNFTTLEDLLHALIEELHDHEH